MGRRRIQQFVIGLLFPDFGLVGWVTPRRCRRHDANLLWSYSYVVNHSQHARVHSIDRDRKEICIDVLVLYLSADCPVDLISYRPNVLSANCLVDQMSCLLNVCRWKISLVKQTSVGLVSVGQLSVGQTSEHQRTCYCLARAHEETNRHIILAYTLIKQEVSNSEPKINLYNSKQTYKFWNISLEILPGSLGNFVSEFWK
jgi:hypothetical protein